MQPLSVMEQMRIVPYYCYGDHVQVDRHLADQKYHSESAIVYCGQKPQHLSAHKMAIHSQRSPQFVVAKGHSSLKIKEN